MLPRVREFYALEELWEAPAVARAQDKPRKEKPRKDKPVGARARGKAAAKPKAPAKKGGRSVTPPPAKRAARPRPSRPRG
jgi:hypothetical protein